MAAKRVTKGKSPVGSGLNEMTIQMLRKDPAFRGEYIKQTLADDDPQALLVSLRRVIDAVGGIGLVSRELGLNRTQLYRTLSKEGKPEYKTISRILDYLGLRLTVERNRKRNRLTHDSA